MAQKKHQMYGKRNCQEQSGMPALPQPVAPLASVQSQPPADMPVKYEYEPYAMHHQPPLASLEGAAGGVPMNKHHAQQHPMAQPTAEMKYSCSLDFARQNADLVGHNHTYTLPQGTGATPRPQARDKKAQKKAEEEHLTRDEKRARALNVSFNEVRSV